MNPLKASLALQLSLLAPLLLLASLLPTNAGYAAKKCDYFDVDDSMLQLPRMRLYEQSLRRVGDGLHFQACTRNQTTAQVRLNCMDDAAYVSRSGQWDEEPAFLSRQAVSQLCDLYGS